MSLYASDLMKQFECTSKLIDQLYPKQLLSEMNNTASLVQQMQEHNGKAQLQKQVKAMDSFANRLLPSNFYQSVGFQNQLAELSKPSVSSQLFNAINKSNTLINEFSTISAINSIDFSHYSNLATQLASLDIDRLFDYSSRFLNELENYEQEDFESLDGNEIQAIEDEITSLEPNGVTDYLERVLANQDEIEEELSNISLGQRELNEKIEALTSSQRKDSKKGFRMAILSLVLSSVLSGAGIYLSLDKASSMLEKSTAEVKATRTYIVRSSALNLRSQADPESTIVGNLYQGDAVKALEENKYEEKTWFMVSCTTGARVLIGWVNADFLRLEAQFSEEYE